MAYVFHFLSPARYRSRSGEAGGSQQKVKRKITLAISATQVQSLSGRVVNSCLNENVLFSEREAVYEFNSDSTSAMAFMNAVRISLA